MRLIDSGQQLTPAERIRVAIYRRRDYRANTVKASSTIARQHIRKVFADLNSLLEATANEPDKTSVHHLRTNTRRVEALILHRLPKGSEGRLLKVLKKVRRRAGTVRDLDVQIDLVEGHTSDASFDDRAVVRTYLETLRAKQVEKLVKRLDPDTRQMFRNMLQRCEKKLVAVHARDGNPGFDAVKAALDQFADVARNYMRIDDDATLHEFRKACKHVRYIAELAGDTPTAQAVIEHLKNLQDAIGEWHDILTLAGNATQALSASKRSPYIRELREEVAAKHAHAIEVAANTREALLALRDHYEAAGKKSPRSVAKKRSRRTGGAVA